MAPNTLQWIEYLAPEILAGDEIQDWKSVDIYAFGIVFYEIVTRQLPYDDLNAMALGLKVMLENKRPSIPEFVPEELVSVML